MSEHLAASPGHVHTRIPPALGVTYAEIASTPPTLGCQLPLVRQHDRGRCSLIEPQRSSGVERLGVPLVEPITNEAPD